MPIDFASVFERSPNAYMVVDRDLRYVAVNAAYCAVTGTVAEQLIGRPVFEVFPNDPDDPENESLRMARASLYRVLETGQSDAIALIKYRVPTRDGSGRLEERFWSATNTPITDAGGQVAFILLHVVDVTALQALEQAIDQSFGPTDDTPLRQVGAGILGRAQQVQSALNAHQRADAAEATQRFLAEAIPQQVWTATPDGHIDFVNNRVLEFFGVPAEQMLDSGWIAFVHPEDRVACMTRWEQSLQTGEEYEFEFRLKRFDGTYRWHLARAVAQLDADGAVVKWFGTNTDMDELKRTRDELHERVSFEQQLIGIVSHDLRNPLDAIGVGTALLRKRGGLDPQQQSVIDRLSASSQRASRLVRDFLDFTQVRRTGRMPVNPVDCNLRDIARQVFDEIQLMRPGRNGRVLHEGPETGFWDPDRLSQLIGNLVANAFQHGAPESDVRLETRGHETYADIHVHNSGAPIPQATLKRLFEPFQRGATPATPGRSLGLGLYIARQIAMAHGGTIDVRSSQGQGTTFSVRLPR